MRVLIFVLVIAGLPTLFSVEIDCECVVRLLRCSPVIVSYVLGGYCFELTIQADSYQK